MPKAAQVLTNVTRTCDGQVRGEEGIGGQGAGTSVLKRCETGQGAGVIGKRKMVGEWIGVGGGVDG